MESQMKQRVVGILVLLFLVAAIAVLLLFGLKQNEKNLNNGSLPTEQVVDANDKTQVQLALPVSGDQKNNQTQNTAVQISQTPRDVISNSKSQQAPQAVANNFGQLGGVQNPSNTNVTPSVQANPQPAAVVQKDDQSQAQLIVNQNQPVSPIVEKVLPTDPDAKTDDKKPSVVVPSNQLPVPAPAVSNNTGSPSIASVDKNANSKTINESNLVDTTKNKNTDIQEAPTASDMLAHDEETTTQEVKPIPEKVKKIVKVQDHKVASRKVKKRIVLKKSKKTNAKKIQKAMVPVVKTVNKPVLATKKIQAKLIKTENIKPAPAVKISAGTIPNLAKTNVDVVLNGWSVKVGSYLSPPNAASTLSKLHSKGLNAYSTLLVTKDQGVLTQIFAGPVTTQAQAVHLLQDVKKKMHITGTIVKGSTKGKPMHKVKKVKLKPTKKVAA